MARRVHGAVGQAAENAALRYLKARGLTLLQRNFRCRRGEIDLIMRDRQTIVFVEVRYRQKSDYVSALESVDFGKQRKLWAAALFFLSKHPTLSQCTCRFDVLGMDDSDTIDWCKDAFRL